MACPLRLRRRCFCSNRCPIRQPTVSHATRYPTRHVSPRDKVAHAIRYPFQWTRSTALPAMRPATPSARRPLRPCRLLRAPPPSKAVRAPIGLCTPTYQLLCAGQATRQYGCPRCSRPLPVCGNRVPHVYRAALCTHNRLEHTVYAPSAEPCCADFSYQNFACSTSQPTPSPRSYDWATSTIACVPRRARVPVPSSTAQCTVLVQRGIGSKAAAGCERSLQEDANKRLQVASQGRRPWPCCGVHATCTM